MKKIICCFLFLCQGALFAQSSFCFRAVRQDQYTSIPTGPRHFACVDLNNDSHMDVAVVKSNSPEISIFMGNGTGVYTTEVSYSQNAVQSQIIGADFNNDGFIDLATVEASNNTFRYFQGNGTGVLSASVDYTVGLSPSSLCSGDFNGDGHLDVAVANTGTNTISLLLGNGTGSFNSAPPQSIFQPSCNSMPTYILSDDFNNDTNDDLIIVDGNSLSGYCHAIYLYLSNGNSTFSLSGAVSSSGGARSAAIGDFNSDGNKDFAATYFDASTGPPTNLSVYLGNGSGGLSTVFSTATQNMPLSLHVGDLDGNSTEDIALVNSTSNLVSCYLNSGNGVMTNTLYYAIGDNPANILIKDVNHDQAADLLVLNSSYSNLISIFGTNDSWFGTPRMYPIDGTSQAYKTTDFNLDGFDDMAFVGGGSIPIGMAVIWGSASNTILSAPQVFTAIGYPALVSIGDMNNDSRPDVVIADNANDMFRIFYSIPSSSFSPGPATVFSSTMSVKEISVGNFNGDNLPDLAVICNGVNSVYIYHQQTGGTFAFATMYAVGTGPTGMAIGDYNGDNRKDIAVCNFNTGNISVVSNLFPSPFQVNSYTFSISNNCGPQQIVSGLFNADNVSDLALVSYNCGLHAFTGTLNGPLNFIGTYTTGNGPISLTANDFNGDGKTDLAVADFVYREFSLHKGFGNGQFSDGEMYNAGKIIDHVSSGDFDGNGTKDLLFSMDNPALVLNQGSFSITISSNTNNVCESSAVTLSVNGQYQYVWSNGKTGNTITIYPTQNSIWSALGVNSQGCAVNSSSLFIQVLPYTPASMIASSAVICYDDGPLALNGTPPGGTYAGAASSGSFIPTSVGIYSVSYTYTDASNCTHSTTSNFSVEECLGMTETHSSDGMVYPNPTKGKLFVTCKENSLIELYTLDGKLILKRSNTSNEAELELNGLKEGVYFLKISHETEQSHYKIVKY